MRHKIEFGGWAKSVGPFATCGAGLALAVVVTGVLSGTARRACAELLVPSAVASPRRTVPSHEPGYLGILCLKSGRGVGVVMVDHDGPAGKAGLRPNDVIVSLNGQPIESAEELGRMIHDAGVGAEIALVVVRGGHQVSLNAVLASRGDVEREAAARMAASDPPGTADDREAGSEEGSEAVPDPPATVQRSPSFLSEMLHSTPFTGLMMEAMEPQLAGFFGAPAGIGLLVETVVPNSPAAAAGLRAGDVVLRIDSVDVRSTGEWSRRLQASRGRSVVRTILRDRHEQSIPMIPLGKRRSRMEWPEGFGRPASAACISA